MKGQFKRVIFIICGVGAVVCLVLVGITKYLQIKDERLQQELLESIEEYNGSEDDVVEEEAYLPKFSQLYMDNQDFIGWICIEDTEINYPVMHTPDDPEYYLRKDFNGDYSIAGTIFASYDSLFAPRSDQVILYGHNMNNGSMFADLHNYIDIEYFETHSMIQFDTLTEEQTYEIVYVFTEDIGVDNPHFEFYNFINASSEQAFDEFIDNCKELSFYDTGNDPVYGDWLLTLVTCTDYSSTERLVVVAKAIEVQ